MGLECLHNALRTYSHLYHGESVVPMNLMIVAGARPNFIKAASIVDAVRMRNSQSSNGIECSLVHTGQHYDEWMSGAFFEDLGLPNPDVNLGVGSASHAQQTAEIMTRFESVICQAQPDRLASTAVCNGSGEDSWWSSEGRVRR